MEAVFRDEVSGEEVVRPVSERATAAELLQEACALFGRKGELDFALEVDGVVVCTGVDGGVSGGEVSVGSLGVHSDSRLVLCRSRDRVLAVVAEWAEDGCYPELSLPVWAWADEDVVLAALAFDDDPFYAISQRLTSNDAFVRAAVARNKDVIGYLSVECRADKELMLAVVKQSGALLQFATGGLTADKDVVMAAVVGCGNATAPLLQARASLPRRRKTITEAPHVTVSTGAVHVSRLVW